MRFQAIATDYDGTLAEDGAVAERTVAALRRARATGRRLVMVTGREIEDLVRLCPALDLFDVVVAENGGLLYRPRPYPPRERLLAAPPPPALARKLAERGVGPIRCGRIIVATWDPHQQVVLGTIREMGLDLHVILNKGAVMVLPSGVNKASGLRAALTELGLDPGSAVGVGDGENDHSLLEVCGVGVAVANAVEPLKDRADLVTAAPRGAGVVEMIDLLVATDFADVTGKRAPRAPLAPSAPAEAALDERQGAAPLRRT